MTRSERPHLPFLSSPDDRADGHGINPPPTPRFDLATAQREAGDYWRGRGWPDVPDAPRVCVQDIALKLGEEAGEVQRAIFVLRFPRAQRQEPDKAKELVDVLVNLLAIADFEDIDLAAEWAARWPGIQNWREWN